MTIFVAVLLVCIESTCVFATPKQSHYADLPSCERALVAMIDTLATNKPEAYGTSSCLQIELKKNEKNAA